MSLVDTLRKDMFKATKEEEVAKADILKMALAAIKNEQIEKQEDLTKEEIQKVLRKEVKKVKDSIAQFKEMGRDDLVAKEVLQLDVLQTYLPQPLSEEEVRKVVETKIEELGAEDMSEMGKVMGATMKELEGKTDGNTVKNIVEDILG
jgi:uncharacterized protein